MKKAKNIHDDDVVPEEESGEASRGTIDGGSWVAEPMKNNNKKNMMMVMVMVAMPMMMAMMIMTMTMMLMMMTLKMMMLVWTQAYPLIHVCTYLFIHVCIGELWTF